jgi:hypothetical protein
MACTLKDDDDDDDDDDKIEPCLPNHPLETGRFG